MKIKVKYLVAIIIFIILVVIGNWPGSGINDEWDNLMDWAKGKIEDKYCLTKI